jgi:hypothetical protein
MKFAVNRLFERNKDRYQRWLGAWYLCIGLGFALLGLRNLLAGAAVWSVALRWIIALGFIVLGTATLRPTMTKSQHKK